MSIGGFDVIRLIRGRITAFHRVRVSFFARDRKSTRLNSSHSQISYAVFCLKKKKYAIIRSGFLWPADSKGDPLKATIYIGVGFFDAQCVLLKADLYISSYSPCA